jgi:hypothetical protein
MEFETWIEAIRQRQKDSKMYANPKKKMSYYVTVKYHKQDQDWIVTRFDDTGIEMEREKFRLKSNAKYIANLWMETKDVTRVYIHKVNGKMDDIIMKGKNDV